MKLFCKNSSIGGFCSLFSDSVFLKNQHCMQYVQVTGRRPRGRPTAHWRLCLLACLGTPQCPLRQAGGGGWSGRSCLVCCPCDLFADKLMKMDGQVWTIDADGSHCWYKKLYDFGQGQVFIVNQLCQSMPERAKA